MFCVFLAIFWVFLEAKRKIEAFFILFCRKFKSCFFVVFGLMAFLYLFCWNFLEIFLFGEIGRDLWHLRTEFQNFSQKVLQTLSHSRLQVSVLKLVKKCSRPIFSTEDLSISVSKKPILTARRVWSTASFDRKISQKHCSRSNFYQKFVKFGYNLNRSSRPR